MIEFKINLGAISYPVFIGENIFESLDYHLETLRIGGSVVILIDEYVAKIKSSVLEKLKKSRQRYYFYVVPGGKNNKSFYSALKILEFLDTNNISRDSTIVAIGGGVIGDMSGFIASCWYRGVDLVHVPTTLLSAVDSCVGGKTAINFRSTVNAVGTYHHPKAILIDVDILKNLPQREISSGFGEIIKYSYIGAKEIKSILSFGNLKNLNDLGKLIILSLKEKEKFVCGDIGEEANRLYLNFGHTIGHAIEFSTVFNGEETLRHGEGVGLGMIAIFKICEKLGHLIESNIVELKETLTKYKLPTYFDSADIGISRESLIERVIDLCFKDKKRLMNNLRLILIGSDFMPFIYNTSNRDLIKVGILEVIK